MGRHSHDVEHVVRVLLCDVEWVVGVTLRDVEWVVLLQRILNTKAFSGSIILLFM